MKPDYAASQEMRRNGILAAMDYGDAVSSIENIIGSLEVHLVDMSFKDAPHIAQMLATDCCDLHQILLRLRSNHDKMSEFYEGIT